jgi:hypothetical protein
MLCGWGTVGEITGGEGLSATAMSQAGFDEDR